MGDASPVRYEVTGGIARVTIARPERMNSLDDGVIAGLGEAFRRANDDPGVRVAILSGDGEHFCAGGDPRWEADFTADDMPRVMRNAAVVSAEIRRGGVVVIGAIRGYCIGGGNELNLHLDVTVASETARFAQPETRWGILPFWGTPQLLPLIVGERRAREMLLFGRMYDAGQALEMGLVNAVVPDEDLEAEAEAWAEEILQRSPTALRLTKVALNAGARQLEASNEHEAAMVGLVAGSESYRAELERFFTSKGNRRPLPAPPRRR